LQYVNKYYIKTSKYRDWAVARREAGTGLRFLIGRYYLYSYTSVNDKGKKGARKISGRLSGLFTGQQDLIPIKISKSFECKTQVHSSP
jgi:hypothetical protein